MEVKLAVPISFGRFKEESFEINSPEEYIEKIMNKTTYQLTIPDQHLFNIIRLLIEAKK